MLSRSRRAHPAAPGAGHDVSPPNHVFVCYNTLSYEAALRIIHDLSKRDPGAPCAMLVLCEADLGRLPERVKRWVLTPPMHALSRYEKPLRIAAWFEEVHRELRAQFPGPVRAYVPHPLELPGNHFVFSRGAHDTVELLPDGLINYFERTMRPERLSALPRYAVRVALECLAAWWHGFRYRPIWNGHQTQYETGLYAASWTFNPEGYLTVSGELKVLPALRGADSPPAPERRAALFLDQELYQVVGPSLEARLRLRAAEIVREQRPEVVYYKAHPRGKNRAGQLRELDLDVVDVSGPAPAEELIAKEGIRIVVGFYSTTLLLLSKQDVEVRIAVLPEPDHPGVRRPALLRDARKAIEASGATIEVAGATASN